MRFFLRFILFFVLLSIAAPLLKPVFPDLSDPQRFWLAVAGLSSGFWLFRKRETKKAISSPPLRLEELERGRAAMPALKWPSAQPAECDPKGKSAKESTGRQDNAVLIESARVRRKRLEKEQIAKVGVVPSGGASPSLEEVMTPLFASKPDKGDAKARPVLSLQDNAALIEAARLRRAREAGEIRKTAAPVSFVTNALKGLVPAPITQTSATQNRQGWVPREESVTIAGRSIGGMVYVGTPPRLNSYGYADKSRPWIDPSLSVAEQGRGADGKEMHYWPSYSEISPVCRATYLDWLAFGRSDAGYDPGYMFLYFYGLERRFIVDQPDDAEKRAILAEVERLAALYADNFSAQRYLGEFIQVARVALKDPAILRPILEFRGWGLPFGLKVALGSKIAAGEPLGWEMVLSWFICHPEFSLRTPATRCAEEFRALFRLRFEERFPEGLKVTKPRKTLRLRYEAASREFHADLAPEVDGKPVPDISGMRRPVEIAQEIAEEATTALDRFSRWLGRNPEGRGRIEGHALLPAELRALFPSAELEALRGWAKDRILAGGTMPADQMIERITGETPSKISRTQLSDAANTMAGIGIGLAPDPRFSMRLPLPDEPMILFEFGDGISGLEDASPAFRAALIQLSLGVFVAQADGEMVGAERQALLAQLECNRELTTLDRRILLANLDWLALVPPDMALLRRKLKEAGAGDESSLRRTLIAAAHADGVIRPEEVAGIERLYKALGLDPALVYSDLHAGQPDAPVRVMPAAPSGPGEAVPPAPQSGTGGLDLSRISAIRADTAQVSSLLGQIFAGESEDDAAPANTAPVLLEGLDARAAALVLDLIKEPHFTEDAFATLCGAHGLMPEGALETVNEWAFDRWDEALLEAYDGYDVAPEIAASVRRKLQGGEMDVQA